MGKSRVEAATNKRLPSLGEVPIELGLKGREQAFLEAVRSDSAYQTLFPPAYPGEKLVTLLNIIKAIAAFERSIISMRSTYDRYRWYATPRRLPTARNVENCCSFPVNAPAAFNATAGGTLVPSDSTAATARTRARSSSTREYPNTRTESRSLGAHPAK